MKVIMIGWIPSAWKTTLANKLSLITWYEVMHTDDVYNSIWARSWYKTWEFPNPKYWSEVENLEAIKFTSYNNKLISFCKNNKEWIIIEWYWMSIKEDRDMIRKLIKWEILFVYKDVDYYTWIRQKWVEDNLTRLEEYKKLKELEELENWIIYL